MGMFQLSAEPIAKKYDVKLVVDWEQGTVLFLTTKDMDDVTLQMFLTEMTVVISQHPIFEDRI